MRIARLNLDRFGHFTDRAFDFGAACDRPDFHIVYGPNEAGKTTLMEAVLRLFYGFAHRETYDFRHGRPNLQVSATLEIDGVMQRFTRLPKRSGALVDETGSALPATALSQHLASLSETDYRQLLCLDDETIERGGEEIVRAQGDIGRLLFSAAAGVADLSAVLDGVRDEAEALWKPRGQKSRIALLKKELVEIEREIRERDVSASAWGGLKKALQQTRETEAEVRAGRDGLIDTRTRIAAQRRALPMLTRIAALEADLAACAAYPARLDFDPERLVDLRTRKGRATSEIERLTAQVLNVERQRAESPPVSGQGTLAGDLEALEDLRTRDHTAMLDLGRRRDGLRDVTAEMARAARDLGVAPEVDPVMAPEILVLSRADLAALEAARETLREARSTLASETGEARRLREALQAAQAAAAEARVEEGTDTSPPEGIGALLQRFDADALATDHAKATEAIAAVRRRGRLALDALRVGSVSFADLPDCPTRPGQAQAWAEEADRLDRDLRAAEEKRAGHAEDAAARQAQAEGLTAGGALISDSETGALRETRERLWTRHVETLDVQSAAAFHAAMMALDEAMDTRLTQASGLGQLRQVEQAAVEALARAAQTARQIAASQEQRDGIEAQVRAAVAAVGLPETLSPQEFFDWVTLHAAAVQEAAALETVQKEQAPVLARGAALQAALAERLDLAVPDFASTLAVARRAAEAERRREVQVAETWQTLRQARRALEMRDSRLAQAQETADAAEQDWVARVETLLGGDVAPDVLFASLEPLRSLRECETKRASASQRIATMEADQAQFAKQVAALAQAHGLAYRQTAAETFAALKSLAESARKALERDGRLAHDLAEAKRDREAHEAALREIAQEVAAIAALLPAPETLTDIDDLRAQARRAEQVIEEREELRRLQEAVLSDLDVGDLAAAREALAGQSLGSLDAASARATADLGLADSALTSATEARVTAARALEEVTGDADIAALVQRRATLEVQLEEAALEHLELSLGERLAAEAIRRYRDSHRSGMMVATERIFSDLTRGAYPRLITQPDREAEVLLAVDGTGVSKRADAMSKGTRFQLYLALRAAAHEQLVGQGTRLPFFCDDIFETFDEDRTSAACRVMERIGRSGQAIYLTHHRHVVEIAQEVCEVAPVVHRL